MSKKILTIDDSKTLRMIVGKHLAPFGLEMLQAENGQQGVERARESVPDVILLDYNMPVMDGYHTLIELKQDAALKSIPVVMLTTETVKETVIKLLKLGLKDYIAKPFTREVLLQKLNPILNLYEGPNVPSEKPQAVVMPEAAAVSPAKPTILAIDDKTSILELLKTYLGEKYYFITADSGKAAVNAIEQKRFDYVFLDLSLPDMSGFDVLDAYLRSNKNGASIKKVAAMSLRTAQADIDRAISAGINILLYKPFSADEAMTAADGMFRQKDDKIKKSRFLTAKEKIRILECPPERSSKFRVVAGSLASDVVQEIDDMAEEGFSKLVIKVGEGFLNDISVTRKFVDLVDHANQLSLQVRFVADSDQALNVLRQFEETAGIPTDTTLECALSAIE
jgi:two-component system, cell cycle response regulator